MNSNYIILPGSATKLFKHPTWKNLYGYENGNLFRYIKYKKDYEPYSLRYGWRDKYLVFLGTYVAHRFIWECFYGILIPEGFVVDHIDGDGCNNHISNLEIVSHGENIRRAKRFKNRKYEDRVIHEFPCSTIL
jgi:hypothetical protein